MLIDLSICIPTFNKSKFIFETLKSIENQKFGSNVEVVILDGASTDNTKEIIDLFKDKINNLRYYLEKKNNGIDYDLDKTVHLAKGRYCWLMSSDDLMTSKSVQFILDKLNSNFDILVSDIYYADVNMKIWGKSKFFNSDKNKLYDISKEKDLVNYIRDSTSNNALFCYMSNIVFLRNNWINFQSNIINHKTCYAHVFKLLSFSFNKKCEILYISEPLVINRPESDSFSSNGIEKRYLLDFEGYLLIANLLFKNRPTVYNLFLENMKKEHNFFRITKLRSNINDLKNWSYIKSLLLQFGYHNFFIFMTGLIGRIKYFIYFFEIINYNIKKTKRYIYNKFNLI